MFAFYDTAATSSNNLANTMLPEKMTGLTKLYPSVYCNAAYVQTMAAETAASGYKDILAEDCGFVQIDNRLVPFKFLARLQADIEDVVFQYGTVLSAEDIFSAELIDSLDEDELAVLMPSVTLLIERGDFGLNLFEEKVKAA